MLATTRTTIVSEARCALIDELPKSAMYVGIGTAHHNCMTKVVVIVLHDTGDEEAVHVEIVDGLVFVMAGMGFA